tara:strand:- start:187 stop:363 length:177 start_codon:yes stop_codon:yes gene_type:complete
MKINNDWERFSIALKFTNNKMIVLVYKEYKYFYFSQNQYKTNQDTIAASNKFIKSYGL